MKHKTPIAGGVNFDLYAVGLFLDVRHFRADHDWKRLRFALRYPLRQIRNREWRHARNYFNGYLAEPIGYPEKLWTTAGTGWTRPAAVRSFWRRNKRHGPPATEPSNVVALPKR